MEGAPGIDVVTRPLVFAALAALAFLPLEHAFPAHARRQAPPPASRRRRLVTDVAFATVGQVVVRLGVVLAVGAALALLDDRFALDRPLLSGIADPRARFGLQTGVGLVLFELAGYGYHRLAHAVPALWRLHEVHHSSRTMDWLAAFRQHPAEILLLTLAQNAPLVLLGVPFGAHAAVLAVLKIATVFVHADIRVPPGPWQLAVATPRFHHRHHQRGGAVRNYASLLPFIDLAFGTYSAETASDFGVDRPSRPLPESFLGLLAHPLRARGPATPAQGLERASGSAVGVSASIVNVVESPLTAR